MSTAKTWDPEVTRVLTRESPMPEPPPVTRMTWDLALERGLLGGGGVYFVLETWEHGCLAVK